MKRFLIIATVALLALSMAFSTAAAGSRRIEQTINALSSAPTIDGEIKSGEYGSPVRVITKGSENFAEYYSLTKDVAESSIDDLPDKSTFYVNYDADYLYIAAEFETPSFTVNNTWFGGSHMLITFTSDLSDSVFGPEKPGIDIPNRLLVWFNSDGELQTKIDRIEAKVPSLNQSVSGDVGASAAKVTETANGHKVVFELALKWNQIVPSNKSVPVKGDHFLLCLTYYENEGDGSRARNTLISAAGTAANINHVSRHFNLTLGDVIENGSSGGGSGSPSTFDAFSIVGVIAAASAAGIALIRRKKF